MVAASQPLAAQVGVDILKAGGNAIDAAVAVNAMLGLVEPHMNGIGGDLSRSFGMRMMSSCTDSMRQDVHRTP